MIFRFFFERHAPFIFEKLSRLLLPCLVVKYSAVVLIDGMKNFGQILLDYVDFAFA